MFASHEVGVAPASVAGYQIVVVFEFGEFAISLQFMQGETQLAKGLEKFPGINKKLPTGQLEKVFSLKNYM